MGGDEKGHAHDVSLPMHTVASRPRRPFSIRQILSGAILAAMVINLYYSFFEILISRRRVSSSFKASTHPDVSKATATEWEDDIWPLREQTAWDISTDYPFPRKLEYDVTEGTWLRLDVHPKSGEIVFDMLGDLYCLPSSSYLTDLDAATLTRAAPILLGIPHDSDPHFSPDGSKVVFRSDAELGVENIWIMEWSGCGAMDVRSASASEELMAALSVKDEEEELLASGVREDTESKQRRFLREGRALAQRVTNETYRWVSDARFHPSGSKIIATKWYTSSRSLGAGEGWEYDLPRSLHQKISKGSGTRLVGRSLPPGWGPDNYGDQQIGPEQFIWKGSDSLIYSKNVKDTNGQYTYSKDVHTGIYSIFETNLTTHRTTTLVSSSPGGATRPELSRDGRTLAFVRRVRDKEALVFKDLKTGTIHHIWHGLTYDLGVISAPMGTYPSFAFTPKDDAVIIWAAGQIYHVPIKTNSFGEKVANGSPKPIVFKAHIEKRIAETVAPQTDLLAVETASTQRVHAFTDLRTNHDGSQVVFQGAGATYVHTVGRHKSSATKEVPVLHSDAPYFSPSFVYGDPDLIIHARWSDTQYTTFELANIATGVAHELVGLPLGRYYSPVLCECGSRSRNIAFIKTGGDYITGDIIATAAPGIYIGEVDLPHPLSSSKKLPVKNIRFISSAVNYDDPAKTKIRFLEKNQKLLVQQTTEVFIIDLKAGPDEFGEYLHQTIASGEMSSELVISTKGGKFSGDRADVAFVDFFHVYFAPGVKTDEAVWSKPGNSTESLARLSMDGGHDIIWSGDGKTLFWFLGPYLHSLDTSKLSSCSSAIAKDPVHFGILCTRQLLQFEEIVVSYASDIQRLSNDARAAAKSSGQNLTEAELPNAEFMVIYNATVLTMETGTEKKDLLHDALLVTHNGKITALLGYEEATSYNIPLNAKTFDAQGGFVVPGFIDVHAHWNGFAEYYPARSWELETFLAYGVTTLHNPSADNVRGFWERFRVERGHAVGPRIYQVGDVIYGAGAPTIHQDIIDLPEAYSALIRIKAEGGPSSFSYKNYNLPSRAARQRLLLAARKLGMLCVPEGGMNYDWDQTYIVDGMTTIEHPLPIPELFDDIITLFALSGTGSTPTHIVNYGGVMGEQFVWANEDIPNDPKLRRFTRHDILDSLSETSSRPKNSFQVFNTTISTAKMVHMGLRAHIGAHGEPPLGLNFHEEMWFTKQGGLTNYEVLRAATSDAAKTLGISSALGILAPGKLADFLVYPPGVDLLEGDISATRDIKYVVRGGRVWDAETMNEVWPVERKRPAMPPLNPE